MSVLPLHLYNKLHVKPALNSTSMNNLVIVEKKNGSLRLCLDPRDLNKAVKREHYKIPTMQEIASEFAGKTVFSTLDLKDGYWQVKLDENSSMLCTFNTPFGRYRFTCKNAIWYKIFQQSYSEKE